MPLYASTHAAGKEYAINQLVLFLSIVSLECEWERERTPQSGELHQPAPWCDHASPYRLG